MATSPPVKSKGTWKRKISKNQEKRRLHDFCRSGNLKKVKEFLKNDRRATEMLNEQAGLFGYTPLHEATCNKRDDVLEQLLLYGGDPNAESNGLYTPLHMAASNGHIKSIRLLLKYNANIKKKNEFDKSPFEIAKQNGRLEAARVLKSAEVKFAAAEDFINIGRLIQDLQSGKDVEKNCFDEALKVAVRKNHQRAAGYLILQGAKNVRMCLSDALEKAAITRTAALLLACHAADIGDKEMLKKLFMDDANFSVEHILSSEDMNKKALERAYLPKEWNHIMSFEQLIEIRSAANQIDMSFPVSIAVNKGKYDAARVLVFYKYCDRDRKTVDWHGLALPMVQDTWISEIVKFEKLVISLNDISVFPANIVKMKHLLRLDLSHNRIASIPKEVLELPMLRNLNLSHNRIKFIPETDDWTKSMKIFNISDNRLKFLPESISSSSLKDLNVARNELRTVQLCVCNLLTLASLDISSNRFITVLPPELGRLTKLDTLEINNMEQINDPPESLRYPTTSLIRHLRASLRGSEPYFTMKLMLVGYANRGKTTLLHRLNKEFKYDRDESTKGVEIKDIVISKGIFNSNEYTFRCWDFAGQEEYYATHQCFLSRRSIYLVIWRLIDGEEGIEALRPWLDNLASRVPSSTVIFVGTHLDKVCQDSKSLQGIIKNAVDSINKLLLSENHYRDHISAGYPESRVILVSNDPQSEFCKSSIETLRQCIYNAAEGMTTENGVKVMGEMIPSSYLSLVRLMKKKQKEMQENGQMPILRREQFDQLALQNVSKTDRDVMDEQDLNIATKFLHDIGAILHYDDPNQGLRDLYFINPSWLCRLMADVVTVTVGYNFYRNGILAVSSIPLILGRNNKEFPQEFYAQYLRLLYRFQIACKIDEERILVPSMLTDVVPEGAVINPSRTVLRRVHSFTCIPHGFWSRFIGRMLYYMKDMLSAPLEYHREDEDDNREEDEEYDTSSIYSANTSYNYNQSIPDNVYSNNISPMGESPFDLSSTYDSSRDASPMQNENNQNSVLVNNVFMPFRSQSDTSPPSNDQGNDDLPKWMHKNMNSSMKYDHVCSSTSDKPSEATSPDNNDVADIATSFSREHSAESIGSTSPQSESLPPTPTSLKDQTPPPESPINVSTSEAEKSQRAHLPERLVDDLPSQPQHNPNRRQRRRRRAPLYANEDYFALDAIEVAHFFRTGVLHCWKTGIIFNHPKLYVCVKTVPSVSAGREAIETTVSKSALGSQVLTFIVDHIRTLVREWYPGLSGHDGQTPYVIQFVPCPICLDFRVAKPHMFDIRKCLLQGLKEDYITCPTNHQPRLVDLRTVCPDLMFQDLANDLIIDSSDLNYIPQPDHVLGEGAFGVAYRGLCGEERVAIKVYKFLGDDDDPLNSLDVFYDVRQEVVILSKLKRHPFIVDFLGVSLRPKLCSVMQLADQGTLKHAIFTKQICLERAVAYKIARQIIDALAFIHFNLMIHRDLKPDNVLLFSPHVLSPVNVKVTDFGTANFVNSTGLQQCIGTPGYIAPEMLEYSKTDEYTVKVDVYAFAILLSVLITERKPYHDVERVMDIDALVSEGRRPTFADCPQSFYGYLTLTELMKVCWQTDPRKRPTSKEILLQSYSPLYLLLIGKIPLVDGYSPRQLCPMPMHKEVWLMCDSPEGSSVVVIDMTKAIIKETLKPNTGKHRTGHFNLALIDSIDSDHVIVVLRGNEDIVLVFNAERKRQCAMILLAESHVESVNTHEDLLLLGLHSGAFWIVGKKEFIKGKLKTLSTHGISAHRPVRDLCCLKSRLYVANSKYIYTCKSDLSVATNDSLALNCNRGDVELAVVSIKCSPCCNYIYTSCYQGSTITKWTTDDVMQVVEVLDCAGPVKKENPAANAIDYRVTCFLPVHDTIWAGTGSGHVIIFMVPSTNEKASILTIFQPYQLEVRSMILYNGNGPGLGMEGSYDNVIVTTGKEIRMTSMTTRAGCLIPLTASYPHDEWVRKSSTPQSPVTNGMFSENVKVILFWQALPSNALKELLGI